MTFINCVLLGISTGFTIISFVAHKKGRATIAVLLLMGAAGSLRILLIGLDPFLHDWDERFHALVAKNMQSHLLLPVLRANPVLAYDYRSWATNHVWVHKQPLFLWQMALSMKLFGVTEIALRLPSALLGTLLLWPVYRLGQLIFSTSVGYYAALFLAFAYYQLELTTGWQSVDHSDVAFTAYVTASIWAYYESNCPEAPAWRWSLVVGLFAGAAVLCKWLPGLVVYAAWAIELLITYRYWQQIRYYGRLFSAVIITAIVVLPWQFYIHYKFPLESAFEAQYAAKHFSNVLEGHGGPWYFYLVHNLWYQYQWLVVLIGIGLMLLFSPGMKKRPTRPLLISCSLIFAFYSIAATKMPSYTYVAAPGILCLAALAWLKIVEWVNHKFHSWNGTCEWLMLFLAIGIDLRLNTLLKHHTEQFASSMGQLERRAKIQRTSVFRHLDALVPPEYIVFNTSGQTDIEAMFYSHRNVYSSLPNEAQYKELRKQGFHLAIFPNPDGQPLPTYLLEADIVQIKTSLK